MNFYNELKEKVKKLVSLLREERYDQDSGHWSSWVTSTSKRTGLIQESGQIYLPGSWEETVCRMQDRAANRRTKLSLLMFMTFP